MSTFTDGSSPSVNPGSGDAGPDEPERADQPPGAGTAESSHAVPEPPGADAARAEPGSTASPGLPLGAPPPPLPDSGPLWLQEQMRKRMAENQASGRGRHARGEESDEQFGVDYLLARDGRGAELHGSTGSPNLPEPDDAVTYDAVTYEASAYEAAVNDAVTDNVAVTSAAAPDDTETVGIEQVPPPGAEHARWPSRARGSWQPDPYSPSGVRAPHGSGRFPTDPAAPPPAGLPPPWYAAPPGTDSDLQTTDVDPFAPIRFDPDDDEDGDFEEDFEDEPDAADVPDTAFGAGRSRLAGLAQALPFATRPAEPTLPAGSDGKRGKSGKEPASSRSTPEPAPTRRVRVVLSERKGVARSVRTVVDIQEGTPVGALLSTNLIGSQLAVALRVGAVAAAVLGLLPALFAIFPELGRMIVLGIRLPWLLLGVLVYPFLLGLGWWHTRAAERVEQNFADHVQD